MTENDRVYLAYMLECIAAVEEYVQGDRDRFFDSRLVRDAVLRNLHTLAESTMRLSQGARDRAADIPWRDVRGFRNIVVHDYFGIDFEKIWMIVSRDLPILKAALLRLQAESSE